MKKLIVFFFVFFISRATVAYTQSVTEIVQIDNLMTALQEADSLQVPDLTIKLADAYLKFDTTKAVEILHQTLDEKAMLLNKESQIKLKLALARILMDQQFVDSANQILTEVLETQKSLSFVGDSLVVKSITETLQPQKPEPQKTRWETILMSLVITLFLLLLFVLSWIKSKNRKQQEANAHDIIKIESHLKTIEKNVEQEIFERTSELNKQVEERRSKDLELKKTLKKVEDANYLKNAFLANMSHEIRTPLNGIIGFSNLLETELSFIENDELYEYAKGIQQSGERLLNLLNNIIDISRIDANDIEVELYPCQINDVLKRVIDLCVFAANEKDIAFKSKLNDIPEILADVDNIMRVFHIIIDNAIKYTKKGFVTITTEYFPETNQVLVRVKDTGVGMDQEYQNHLFEAFRQESSGYGRSYQGAGLGLPLAKRLLDLMHGSIKITSHPNVGTTVDIYFSCDGKKATEENTENKPKAKVPTIGNLDIFIVEDDRMNRMVLKKMLIKLGTITMVEDGQDCLRVITENYNKGHIFEVMLFDINLPVPWDGIKLMKKIREDFPEYKQVPFIAQTAYAMAGDKERLLEAGFDDYIAKPINKNELATMVQNQIIKYSQIKNIKNQNPR
ncbi:MAG: response regulator [Lentimicrobiaceae bacterium]|jgi:signal transduction histidine kinase/ActR/RegA family two-component response regulator|nr:response regulator [Lentimicrobiaceae bacterium]